MANTLFSMLGSLLQGNGQQSAGSPGGVMDQLAGALRGNPPQQGDVRREGQTAADTSGGGQDSGLLGQIAGTLRGSQGATIGVGALGGVLGSLLGGGGARSAIASGGAAALAAVALNMYQSWSQKQQAQAAPSPNGRAYGEEKPAEWQTGRAYGAQEDPMALLLLEALANAARADGHVDEDERAAMETLMARFFPQMDVAAHLAEIMRKPIDPQDLSRRVTDPDQRRDIYRLSSMVIIVDTPGERAYLNDLAGAFGITPAEQQELDANAQSLRQGTGEGEPASQG